MTTTTKSKRKIKLDWQAIIQATPPVEPKTLDECLVEAGGYPFSAVVIADDPERDDTCKGFIFTAVGPCKEYNGSIVGLHHPYFYKGEKVISSIPLYKRWQLLGHIPGGAK